MATVGGGPGATVVVGRIVVVVVGAVVLDDVVVVEDDDVVLARVVDRCGGAAVRVVPPHAVATATSDTMTKVAHRRVGSTRPRSTMLLSR